ETEASRQGGLPETQRIDIVQRVVRDVSIQICPARVSDRISLEEAPPARLVHTGTGVIEAVGLGIDAQPGVAERPCCAVALAVHEITSLGERPGPGIQRAKHRTLDVGNERQARASRHIYL